MKIIHLYGGLAMEFAPSITLAVTSVREALRGLAANFPGFENKIQKGYYSVVYGTMDDGDSLYGEMLRMHLGEGDIHIVPTAMGAAKGNSKGIFKIIAGIALLGIGILGGFGVLGGVAVGATLGAGLATEAALGITWGTIALMGAGVLLAGVSSMLTPTAQANFQQREAPDQRASFLFQDRPVNTIEQGQPVPLVYGQFRVGSFVMSGGLFTEDIPVEA